MKHLNQFSPEDDHDIQSNTHSNLPFFSLKVITEATGNFGDDNKLGQGGFGSVYKVTQTRPCMSYCSEKCLFCLYFSFHRILKKNDEKIVEWVSRVINISGVPSQWTRDSGEKIVRTFRSRDRRV